MKRLKIFLVIPESSTGVIGNSNIWYHNLYEPLIDLGHEVSLFSIDKNGPSKAAKLWNSMDKDQFSDKLIKYFDKEYKRKGIDIFFSYLYDYHIDPQVIKIIKEKGILTLNFSCNNTHQFYLQENLAKVFDINLYSEKNAKLEFDKINVKSIWFQMAANPNYYKNINLDYSYNVSFIGQKYSNRANYLNFLLENDIDIKIFGLGWRRKKNLILIRSAYAYYKRLLEIIKYLMKANLKGRYKLITNLANNEFENYFIKRWENYLNGPLRDNEMINVFNSSKINVGFSEVFVNHDYSEIKKRHLHLRDFEVPMCGGCYCIQYSDELCEFYEPDKEVIVYESEFELLKKIQYYLINDKERENIRQAGYNRAQSCHTYHKRFNDLFSEIILK